MVHVGFYYSLLFFYGFLNYNQSLVISMNISKMIFYMVLY